MKSKNICSSRKKGASSLIVVVGVVAEKEKVALVVSDGGGCGIDGFGMCVIYVQWSIKKLTDEK